MTLHRPERKNPNQQTLSKEAIDLAIQGRWQEAVERNQEIVKVFSDDVNAYNRLGKALMELGRYAEARDAFSQGLDLSPSNTIAKKNLQRLSFFDEVGTARQPTPSKVAPHQFIEETGKTGVTKLVNLGQTETRVRLGAGDPIQLRIDGKNLMVESTAGEYIGQVEQRLALRLTYLMEGGNRYEGAITSAGEDSVTVILREVYQDPSQAEKVSFPSKSADGFRSYVKQSIKKYELGEEVKHREVEPSSWEEEEGGADEDVPEGITIIDGGRDALQVVEEDEEDRP